MSHTDTATKRTSISGQISALGAKLSRALSTDSDNTKQDLASVDSLKGYETKERSVSRGREAYQSSGRGGLGNIRSASKGGDAGPYDGPDDFSPTRGREGIVDPTKVLSSGRGGAGNIRSPSRDAQPVGPTEYEQTLVRDHLIADQAAPHSSGRGGLGNFSRSRSRDVNDRAPIHTTGRGGAGNYAAGEARDSSTYDDERKSYARPEEGVHSTGRGGAANLTSAHAEPENIQHQDAPIYSSGRGGAGNIRNRSTSREPARSGSRERSALGVLIDRVAHHGRHDAPVPEE